MLFFMILTGCGRSDGPRLGQVSGTVTLNGKPVSNGVVTFMSEEGFGASAPLNAEGNYTLRSQYGVGIPLGNYKVIVAPPSAQAQDLAAPSGQPTAQTASEIPKKYHEFATSGFEFKIERGKQEFDLDLTP